MKLDNKTIETLSVNAVKNSIVTSPFLDQFINENDKEPSWDGFVYIYEDSSKKKDKLKGRLPVQVKGTEISDFSKNEITFSMEVVDLRNYLYDGGVILFVVYINGDIGSTKVYYAELTPIKLRFLLNEAGSQSTKSIRLKEFPTDGNKKATIFLNCLQNCQKQASFTDTKLLSLDELQKMGMIENLTIPFSGVGIDDPKKALVTNEMYLYAKLKGSNVLYPIEILPKGIYTEESIYNKVFIEDEVFYEKYNIIKDANSTTLKFGESFKMIFNEPEKTCNVTYKNSNMLRILARDLDFLLAYIDKGYFKINDMRFPFEFTNVDFSNFDVENQKQRLSFSKRSVQVLDMLNCKKDIDLSKISEEEIKNLDRLAKSFIDKKLVNGLKIDLPPVANMKIENCLFTLVFHKESEDGTYSIYDFFRSELSIFYENENGDRYPVSQYSIFSAEDLIKVSNLRPELFLPSFKKYNNRKDFTLENKFLLELIKAFDLSKGKRNDLLKVAKDFAVWIKDESGESLDYTVKVLNYYQIIKRERDLNIIEITELWNIAEDSATTNDCKVGAYLLLDQTIPAEKSFAKLNSNVQQEFKTYPIYHFWKNKEEI